MPPLAGLILALGVFYVLIGAILDTGSSAATKEQPNEPTELDAELEAHIDSFN